MQKTLLSRLQRNGRLFIAGALLLLIGVPLYQTLLLIPQGYNNALSAVAGSAFIPYLLWIGAHSVLYLGSRLLLVLAFLLLLSLPFSLFRIIVAQELVASEEMRDEEATSESEAGEQEIDDEDEDTAETDEAEANDEEDEDVEQPEAWRGKGFVVLGAWTGIAGIVLFLLGTLASAIYFTIVGSALGSHPVLPGGFLLITSILTITANTAGSGLIALSCFFFGVVIARRGVRLWPRVWVLFGYVALAVAALLIVAAVTVATAPTQPQGTLATLSVFLFALWVLWLGVMLVSLKPEA